MRVALQRHEASLTDSVFCLHLGERGREGRILEGGFSLYITLRPSG